jgi:glycosyltransferase involved in cell wall biosynthesis
MQSENISVVIPLYNKSKYVSETLDSVFNQTILPNEIIIVNNNSTDDSIKICEKYPVKIINEPNQGVSYARNNGINIAKNNWVALLDADDIWDRNHILNIHNLIKSDSNCSIIFTDYTFNIHDLGHGNFTCLNYSINSYLLDLSNGRIPITSSSIAFRKNIFDNFFPVDLNYGEDQITWLNMMLISNAQYIQYTSVYYRKNNTSLTADTYNKFHLKFCEKLNNMINLFDCHLKSFFIIYKYRILRGTLINFALDKKIILFSKLLFKNNFKNIDIFISLICFFPYSRKIYKYLKKIV